MVNTSTETRGGRIETRYDDVFCDEGLSYEDVTELLLLLQAKKKPKQTRLPVRLSLFPHVAPYILFQFHDSKEKLSTFPKELSKHLTWELSTVTPWIVRKTVENSGYRIVYGREDWCGIWSECRYAICYKLLKKHQKINHFPGLYEIGHKDRLWKNVSRLMSIFGKKQFGFVPQTFILPQDLDQLREAWEKNKNGNKWILKPAASSRGRGVSVVGRWTQIPRKKSFTIVQEYLSRPKLINDLKFDLRFYALVTDFNPLKIYVYSEGLVRFACAKYDCADVNLCNRFIHLTNYSVNKSYSGYVSNDSVDERKGHKWSLKCLWNYLSEQDVNVASLRRKIDDIIVKTIISGETSVNCFSRVHLSSRHNCYELLGLDILIDENLKPWLLEVNISPSLHVPSSLDLAVKGNLVKDVLNVVGYRVPSTLPSNILRKMAVHCNLDSVCQDVRATADRELSAMEKRKQMQFACHRDRGDCLESILDHLTPDDVRHLVRYEDELSQLGQFRKVFPTPETHKYLRFFDTMRYYNLLLSAWENAYGNNRRNGIAKLRDLCSMKYHLS